MKLSGLLVLAASAQASAKAVFAHFMVGNVATWGADKWKADIALAQSAHIDAFALNIAADEPHTVESLDLAFSAASSLGFKLFFSFDYAGNGPFDKQVVISYINKYAASSAYFRHNGKPFVSTFEGPLNAADWVGIKSATGCFFVPDWSSEGAKAALALVPGVPDGLFSWAAWPWGDRDSNTYTDASYLQYLNDTGTPLPYMMPVSPWFYTNLPGYNKNWLWRGDDLWYDRWEEAIWVQPDFIEIISWNDYGESHYIGPLHDDGFDAFSVGKGPFNFAKDMPHDGWRQLLPFVIDLYKTGIATVTEEAITAWYRLTPKAACGDGDTTGNTASQLQIEFTPAAVMQDKIFYSALLSSAKSVTVTVGGVDLGAKWTHTPSDPIGIYHGSVAFGSHTGPVVVTVGGMVFSGESITTSCNKATGQNGLTNWNAWVGSQIGGAVHATPALNMSEQVCVEGTGATGFSELCEYTCQYSYCPIGACYCTKMGAAKDLPLEKNTPGFGTVGYPAAGKSADYSGLCAYACNYGYCPEQFCSTTNSTLVIPTSSPFDPPACTSGTGSGDLEGLCSFACNFGYCPIHSCTCLTQGALHEPPDQTKPGGSAAEGKDSLLYDGLCNFACSRNYCPAGACKQDAAGAETAYIGRDVYVSHTAQCSAPCIMVLPPSALPSATTISVGPYTTSLEVAVPTVSGGSTIYAVSVTTITITPPAITTTEIPFSNVEVTTDARNGFSFQPTPSVVFPPVGYPITISTGGTTTVTTRSVTLPPWPFVGSIGTGGSGQVTTDVQNPYPSDPPASTSTAVVGVLPVWKTWPPGVVTPVTDKIKDIGPLEDASGTSILFPCNIWFMNLCTDKIGGWKVSLPKGVIGPGPPPRGYFDMAGWDFPKPLPPWPKITVGNNNLPTFSEEPSCETVSASICSTTTSYGLSASAGVTKTTTTSVMSTCETIRGCSVKDYDTATATAACSTRAAKREQAPQMTEAVATSVALPEATIVPRQGDTCEDPTADTIVYMGWNQWSDDHVAPVIALLKERGVTYNQFRTDVIDGGYTPFLHIGACPQSLQEELKRMPQVAVAYDYIYYQKSRISTLPELRWSQPTDNFEDSLGSSEGFANNITDEKKLWSRGESESLVWQTSQISTPPGADWVGDTTYSSKWDGWKTKDYRFRYYYEDEQGAGQYIYVLEEAIDPDIARLNENYEQITMPDYGPTNKRNKDHGTKVAACAAGEDFSLASRATVILVETGDSVSKTGDKLIDATSHCLEKYLAALISVLDDVKKKNRQGKSVVNLSWSVEGNLVPAQYSQTMIFIFQQLEALDVAIVTSAGNLWHRGDYCDYNLPQRLLRPDAGPELKNLIVVGSTDENGRHAYNSELFDDRALAGKIVYAPGVNVFVPELDGSFGYTIGTSFATPLVASLIAYVRSLDSPWAATFAEVEDIRDLLVEKVLQRKLTIARPDVTYNTPENPGPIQFDQGFVYAFIWNGQVQGESCFKNGQLRGPDGKLICPEELQDCSVLDGKRQSCTLPGGGGGSSGGGSGLSPSPVTWQPGTPSPTCTSNCGSLCKGFYCKPNPTGNPPDYSDPKLHPTSTTATSSTAPTSTSKPATPSNPVRVPSRDARWDLFNMAVTLDGGSTEHVWVGFEDTTSHSVAEFLEDNSKCYNPDWMAESSLYPSYPSDIKVQNFFGASDCKFVFQVGSQSEWLGLDSDEWLGNVICSEYDYAECFKDTDKTFYSCDDLDAVRTRWAYCTWDHWFTSSSVNTRVATLSRLAAVRKLKAETGMSLMGLESDGSVSMNMTSAVTNGTASHKFI